MSVQDEEAIITIKVRLESTVEGDPTGPHETQGGRVIPALEEELNANKRRFGDVPGDVNIFERDRTSKSPMGYSQPNQQYERAEPEYGQPEEGDEPEEWELEEWKKQREAAEKAIKTPLEEKNEHEGIQKATEFINEIEGKGVRNLTQFATSPQGFMEHGLIRILSKAGPHGAIAVAIITAILAGPQLVEAVVKALGVKGGLLNQDYRFSLSQQFNQMWSRLIQFRKLTGDERVITAQDKGFAVGDPDFVNNNLVDSNISRVGRVGLRHSSLGDVYGV